MQFFGSFVFLKRRMKLCPYLSLCLDRCHSPHLTSPRWLLKNLECQVRFKALEEELERKKGSEVPMVSNFRARESSGFEALLCLAVRKLSFRMLRHTFMLVWKNSEFYANFKSK